MKTSNYELFSFFETNRPLSRKKVDRFKQSFIEVGYNEAFPVLCDDKYRIIDAQHRFQACKEMGLPIFYQFDKSGIPPETMMVELNKVQTAWSTDAYILHFAKLGVKFHKSVVEFSEKHGLAIAVSANIVCQSTTKLLPKVRDGINLPLNPRREEIAEFILSCKNTSFYKQKNFIGAVCSLFKRANNFQIEKIKRKIMSIPAQVSSTAYLMAFENIINKNTATKDRIILQKI